MKRLVISVIAVAVLAIGASLVTPTSADASCACLQRTINDGTQCETVCCAAPAAPDPANPPSGACGELCLTNAITDGATGVEQVEELILVAGSANQDAQAGCVGLLGGTLHSGQFGPLPPAPPAPDPNASYAQCKADAAAACEANGCFTSTVADGACGS